MANEVWRITDFSTGEDYHFCSEPCADVYDDPDIEQLSEPEDVTDEYIEIAYAEKWHCDWCRQPIVKPHHLTKEQLEILDKKHKASYDKPKPKEKK